MKHFEVCVVPPFVNHIYHSVHKCSHLSGLRAPFCSRLCASERTTRLARHFIWQSVHVGDIKVAKSCCMECEMAEQLGIRAVESGGEGNCLYHAVACVLMGHDALRDLDCDMDASTGALVASLRARVAEQMVTSPTAYEFVQRVISFGDLDSRDHRDTWVAVPAVRAYLDAGEANEALTEAADAVRSTKKPVVWGSQLEVLMLNEWLLEHSVRLVVVTPRTALEAIFKDVREHCAACVKVGFLLKSAAHYQGGQRGDTTLFDADMFVARGGAPPGWLASRKAVAVPLSEANLGRSTLDKARKEEEANEERRRQDSEWRAAHPTAVPGHEVVWGAAKGGAKRSGAEHMGRAAFALAISAVAVAGSAILGGA